ncbi:phasin family protein [Rivibacter subsaxonicus]|uniref:Poly(Hydroxyalkanoate) granule-associated protein n=1 Tax=Rivibacter subsaxonicus TaxID=457575 RepID=A0A4Q7VG47_9BURK|nr:phasin family protein [Rivibacter subsaxonicus]RZT94982.1 poly(hydroxyalkanoate) granule-associated protein [Rivibacter subsaxonicus]
MVKKLKNIATKKAAGGSGMGQLLDSQLATTVRDSAQQIWLAGLGAFAKAQGEGGKVFETLVKEGVSIQRKTQAVAEEKIGEVASRMSNLAGDVQTKAGHSWDKLETIFEERVAKALAKLGVPSSKEIETLIGRIDKLSAQVAKLGGAKAAPVKRAAPVAKKAAAAPKKAVAKKAPVAKKAAAPRRKAAAKVAAPATAA